MSAAKVSGMASTPSCRCSASGGFCRPCRAVQTLQAAFGCGSFLKNGPLQWLASAFFYSSYLRGFVVPQRSPQNVSAATAPRVGTKEYCRPLQELSMLRRKSSSRHRAQRGVAGLQTKGAVSENGGLGWLEKAVTGRSDDAGSEGARRRCLQLLLRLILIDNCMACMH